MRWICQTNHNVWWDMRLWSMTADSYNLFLYNTTTAPVKPTVTALTFLLGTSIKLKLYVAGNTLLRLWIIVAASSLSPSSEKNFFLILTFPKGVPSSELGLAEVSSCCCLDTSFLFPWGAWAFFLAALFLALFLRFSSLKWQKSKHCLIIMLIVKLLF